MSKIIKSSVNAQINFFILFLFFIIIIFFLPFSSNLQLKVTVESKKYSFITIFSTTKTQNVPSNSGAKVIFFGSIATVHNYFWLFTVAER